MTGGKWGLMSLPFHSSTQRLAVLAAVISRVHTVNEALQHEVDHVVQPGVLALCIVAFRPGLEGRHLLWLVHLHMDGGLFVPKLCGCCQIMRR